MREIKFRAWDKFEGMIYSKDEMVITPAIFGWDDFKQDHYGRINKMAKVKNGFGWFVTGHSGKLMQYTGLKDRNGKEIYEGDIVTWGYGPSIVRLAELEEDDEEGYPVKRTGWIVEDCFIDCNCTIIGNIYENPELIKEEA